MLKKNEQLFNLMFLFFYSFYSNVPDDKCHKQKWCVLFFINIKTVTDNEGMDMRLKGSSD